MPVRSGSCVSLLCPTLLPGTPIAVCRRIIGFEALCRLTPADGTHKGRWALVLEYAKVGRPVALGL
jgi:hypothetical protein